MCHRASDSASSMVTGYICSSHSTLPSRRPGCWIVSSLFCPHISSSIPVYSLAFVSLVDVCPASSEHTLSPWGYELLFLSSIPFVGESRSWRRMASFCVRWLVGYYRCVRLTAIVGTSRSDRNLQMSVSNLPALGWFFPVVRQYERGTPLTCVV